MIRCLFTLLAVFMGFCSFGLYICGHGEAAAGPLLQTYVDMMNNKLYTLDIVHEQDNNGQKTSTHDVYVVSGDSVYEKRFNNFNGNEFAYEVLYIGDKRYDLSHYSTMEKGKRKFFSKKIEYITGSPFRFSNTITAYFLGALFQPNSIGSCIVYSGCGEENIRGKLLQYEEYVPENNMIPQRGRYYFDQGKLVAFIAIQSFELEGKKINNRNIITFKQFIPEVDESLLTIPENIKQIEVRAVVIGNHQIGTEGSISYD